MKIFYTRETKDKILSFLFFCILFTSIKLQSQSFSQDGINFNGNGTLQNGTSLTFGPDGRLYVTEYTGSIKIFTIERLGSGNYSVTNMEEIKGIHSIQDYNDDGTLYSGQFRETIGLAVTGTAANPVLYVSSSDFRIGGGGGGGSGDVGLDTNSGIITRYTWNGSSWDEVDLVRGLPRSEENHATNGIEFATINGIDYLIVAQGGHTNAGGPSTNFAYTTEYALSAALLSVNLTMLEAMPVLEDNGRKYIYDLPTLDDPTRPNKNGITDPDDPAYDGIDINDPFGGNDGLNQTVIVPGGPVQIFSPGYRNAYDLVVTQSGAVYVTDNGANGGWGGFPVNEGGEDANNDYDPNEPGSTSSSDGEQINNKDHLSLVTLDIQNYTFGSFYGGHPTPVRANPYGAGLYTNPAVTGTQGAIFRTQNYDPDGSRAGSTTDPSVGLPANWPPVLVANPVEGDYRSPGALNPDGPVDAIITTWGTNTNGIDEYTASNFESAMKGDLIAGVNTGELRRVELNPDGTLKNLTPSFASGIGGDALGITCNGDNDIFPGTIWVATLNGKLVVLEPQDFIACIEPEDPEYDPNADNDYDGYTNQDELDNGTDPCNGGSQPSDFDKAVGAPLISDHNDSDDDNDGITDSEDPFQLGDPLKSDSDAFDLPVINELFSSNPDLQGYMGLGMTGLMNNNDPNPNWVNWLDRRDDPNEPNPNDILGGAIGAMTMHMTAGTALGTTNTQEKGFQYGVKVSEATGEFTVAGGLMNFKAPLQLYGHPDTPDGELGFFIGDGTQSNYIKFVITKTGLLALQEINDVPSTPVELNIPPEERPDSGAAFYFVINPSTGEILLEYSFDSGLRSTLGTFTAQGSILEAIKLVDKDLAVGFIGSSNAPEVELEGTWDYMNVTGSGPFIVQIFKDMEYQLGATGDTFDLNDYFNDDKGTPNLTYTVVENTNPIIEVHIAGNILDIIYPSSPASTTVTLRATDEDQNFVEQTFMLLFSDAPLLLYRVNSGGPAVLAIDDELDWSADTAIENSPYLAVPGSNTTAGFPMTTYSSFVDQSTTPVNIFDTERYDGAVGTPNLTYSFPVPTQGSYSVRLYMGNGWGGTSLPGQRVFDVEIEGFVDPQMKNVDLSALFGHSVGGVIEQIVTVTDGSLDISFIHAIENPLINGIEIFRTSQSSNPIQVVQLEDQMHLAGDQLDGSLVVQASGGDGNLSYSMSGAPAGVVIEPTNGQIGGTIAIDASNESPYSVTITVDDNDENLKDAVTMQFQWYITTGEPFIVKPFPDKELITGAPEEQVDLNEFFDDNGGVEKLIYSLAGYVEGPIVATVSANILTLNYPEVPAESIITIRATDIDGNFVEQTMSVKVIEAPETLVLYRVNAGGPAIISIDTEMDWGADTGTDNSPYLIEAGSNSTGSFPMNGYTSEVDQNTTPLSIFDTERFDLTAGAPNMTYSFPVPQPGNYEIRLYFGNGYGSTALPGERIFDVSIEGVVYPEFNDIDLSGTFGHKTGTVIKYTVEVTDGLLDISLIHGAIENPLINGIEILNAGSNTNIEIAAIADQENFINDELDGSLTVIATGGDGALNYTMTGAPAGVNIDPATGAISGTIAMDADVTNPYSAMVTVDDSDDQTSDAVTTIFTWTITSGTPVIVQNLQDLQKYTTDADDNFNLNLYFNDNDGVENLAYSITVNTEPLINAVISANLLTLDYSSIPAKSNITVRATDTYGNYVEQSFHVDVKEEGIPSSQVLYRVNAGGPAIPAIDGEIDWGADTGTDISPFLIVAGSNSTGSFPMNEYTPEVDLSTTPSSIFDTERFDLNAGAPNMTYSFPIPQEGDYEVRLFLGNGYGGTASPGERIFDISIEGVVFPEFKDIDLSGTYGHKTGTVISYTIKVTDGFLDISLIHGVIENPLINGIELLNAASNTDIQIATIADQNNTAGDVLDENLVVIATGGDGALEYSIVGGPSGVVIDSATGAISGIISTDAASETAYVVTVTVDDSDAITTDAVSVNFNWKVDPVANEIPFITQVLPDLERFTGAENETINLINYFDDDRGAENLSFTIEGNTDSSIGAVISSSILNLNYSSNPAQSTITIRATDVEGGFAEQSFTITVTEECAEINRLTWYADVDGDGLGDSFSSVQSCEQPEAYVDNNLDCDDTNPEIGIANTWYADKDGDGFGAPEDSLKSCSQPDGYVADNTDCDDNDKTTFPGAAEICDGKDNNCNGTIDEDLETSIWYADKDGDSYGAPEDSLESCTQPAGYVADNTDCNDNDNTIYPGATEVPNDGIDQNCDGEDLVEVVFQGCTAEFWAGSFSWCTTYQPTDSFFTVFKISNKRGLGGKTGTLTLQEALNSKGGGYNKLAKQATAALLNACSPVVNYSYTETQLKIEVQDAFNNSAYNNSYANSLSSVYETANNAGCPTGDLSALTAKSSETLVKDTDSLVFNEEPDVEESIEVKLYPNPAQSDVYLKFSNSSIEVSNISLYDNNGRFIRAYDKFQFIDQGEGIYLFNISGLPDGVYLLKIFTGDRNSYSQRLIVEN